MSNRRICACIFIGYTSPMNILGSWPRHEPRPHVLYIPQLTEEHMQLIDKYIDVFYIKHVLATSPGGAPPK
jgi:hypothetical protein